MKGDGDTTGVFAQPPGDNLQRRSWLGVVLREVALRVLVYGGLVLTLGVLLGCVPLPSFLTHVLREAPPGRATEETSEEVSGLGWPHLRGPRFNATSDERFIADHWPDEGPPVLWFREIGRGYSGFSTYGGRVWTQRQTVTGQTVLCLDGDTGETLWEYRYDWPYEAAGMYPGPRATPTWYSDRIYFAGPNGLVGCLRSDDGQLLWSRNVTEQFGGRGTDFGYASSPTLIDGRVLLPVGGEGASLVALDAEDGSTVWTSGDQPASYCSAIPISLGGRTRIVGYLQNALTISDLETGALLWGFSLSHGYDEHAAMPLYDEPYLAISGPFRSGMEMWKLSPVPAEETDAEITTAGGPAFRLSGERVWHNRQMSNDVASSVLADGHIYGFDLRDVQAKVRRPSRGQFRCLDWKTGQERWVSGEPGHASLIVADGKLILFNDRGQVILLRRNPEAYEELARADIFPGEICWTAPALDRGRLYLRSPTRAACLYIGEPERLNEARLAQSRQVSELPRQRQLKLGWLLNGERDCPADPPSFTELKRWYGVSLLVLVGASGLALLTWFLARCWRSGIAIAVTRVVFWAGLFLLGVIATPLLNRHSESFVFTWPVTLFAAHQVAMSIMMWARRQHHRPWAPWISLATTLACLFVCVAYFDICRRLDQASEWIFLLGFVPSWPVTLPAAHTLVTRRSPIVDILWAWLGFAAYYWGSTLFILWRS